MNSRVTRVAPLLFGSGICALIYQVVWLREMRFIFGASTAASAAVLAIFMGGLGLGGALLGKRADQRSRPLEFYAQLELLIAGSAAVTPALVWIARQVYIGLGGTVALGLAWATVVRLGLAALVLCVPTLLMGGTLPAAAKAVETDADVSRRNLAVLYGTNTLGAVTGAFVSTFFMLEFLGTRMTLWVACLVNLGVALSALALARTAGFREGSAAESRSDAALSRVAAPAVPDLVTRRQKRRQRQRSAYPTTAERQTPSGLPRAIEVRGGRLFVLAAAGIVGFAFLLMELVWYRMLGPILGGSSFTFGLILAVALLGIGLGGAAYALFGPSRPATLSGFALSCVLEAVCIAFPYALGDWVAFLAMLLRPLGAVGFHGLVLAWTLVAMLVVFPAAFVAGVQFPLLIALLGRGGEAIGRDTGQAYAWNTVGAILGSLAGGFGLLPLLSAPGAWRAVVWILVVLGVVAALLSVRMSGRWSRVVVPLAAAVVALLMVFAEGPTTVWRHSAIGAGRSVLTSPTRNGLRFFANIRRHVLRWEVEGVESSVALEGIDGYAFAVNGKIDGNARNDAPTQIMGGLIGAILHPKPRRALVIGLGTGSTAGWLGVIPSMERVDVVELEPSILRVAKECAPVNLNVLNNPKVHIFIGDAREVLLTTTQRYDIIFSEPSNPYRAGIASLFTKEFYQAVASRLADGGIFAQWLQAYEVDSQTIRTAYATMASVFPAVETWQTHFTDMLLVASRKPIEYDVPTLREHVEQEPYKSALAVIWSVTGLEGFLSHYVANNSLTMAIAQEEGDVLNTDDRTLVEFAFARSVGRDTPFSFQDLGATARAHNEHRPAVSGGEVDWADVDEQLVNLYTLVGDRAPVESYFTGEQRVRVVAQNFYAKGNFEGALTFWRAQKSGPVGRVQLALVAESLADASDEEALPVIEYLRSYDAVEADAILARLRFRQDRLAEATDALETAFRNFQLDPWPQLQVANRALILATQIAKKDKALGLRLYHVLRTPFAIAAMNDVRVPIVLQLAKDLDFEKLCVETLALFEPYPVWEEDFLSDRVRCYRAAGDARAAQAQRDLDAFMADASVPFERETPPPEVSASPAADQGS